MCDMKRSEQRVENTWKMEDIYASMEAYNADVQKVQALLKEYEALQGTLGKDAECLLRALMLDEQISMIYSELAVYANQRYHEDTGNAVYQKLTGEVQTLGVQMMQSISWFQPELLALPEARLTQYYAEEPKLEGYRRQVEEVTRMRDHILDTKTEELLARMSELADAPANIFSMFNNADIRFPDIEDANGEKHTLTIGSYISYMESRDRTLRENAFHALYSVYRQYRNTIAAMYYANAKQADVMAKEHHYDNAMQQALDASAIPVSVYENLIGTINRRLPAMYRYVELRKKLLGVETLHMYEERLEAGYSEEEIMRSIHAKGRDNARTPMQWTDDENAGFTDGTPWLAMNPNYRQINVREQEARTDSVLAYYRRLVHLRKADAYRETFTYGIFEPAYQEMADVFAYYRVSGESGQRILVAANFGTDAVSLTLAYPCRQVLLSNLRAESAVETACEKANALTLGSCEVAVIELG